MLDTTNLAIASFVAHALHGTEIQPELQVAVSKAVARGCLSRSGLTCGWSIRSI